MGSFPTAKDAKKFLVDRVREQAAREGYDLTPAGEYGLAFSVEDLETDEELQSAFEREWRMEEFEKWTKGVLERALERDRAHLSENVGLWEEAYDTLRRGDHYVLVVLKPVVRPGLGKRLWKKLRG